MSRWHDWVYRFEALTRRGRHELEMDEELRHHLEMDIEHRMAGGMARADAEREARLAFGGTEAIKEACRDAWGTRLIDDSLRDLSIAGRRLLRSPVFTGAAVLSLAIGFGVATLVFSLVDAVLIQPLPFDDSERVVAFHELTPQGDRFSTSDPNLLDFRAQSRALEDVAGVLFPTPQPALRRDDTRVRLQGQAVTPSFFQVFGVRARLGRTFTSEEAQVGDRPRVVVLTDRGWRRHFLQDPNIVGRDVDLDGETWTVIGVLPEEFRLWDQNDDIFLPYVLDPAYQRGDHRLTAFARLKPKVDIDRADEEVASLAARLASQHPESNAGWSAELQPIDDFLLGSTTRQTNYLLLVAVGLLVLLACVNVSNLLLARAGDRADELGLRLALGAGRARVLRQLVTESLLLGLLSGAGALLLAWMALPWVRALDVALPRMDSMVLDLRVSVLVLFVSAFSGLLLGLGPALKATTGSMAGALRTRRQGQDPSSRRLRAALVMAEVALAMVLTLGAALLLRSFETLHRVDSGFETHGVLLAQIDLPVERYGESAEATRTFFSQLEERLEGLPGVDAVGGSMVSPFRGPQPKNKVAPETEVDRDAFVPIHWRGITPGYFRTLGIPLQRGRTFDNRAGGARLETVVSAGLAERLWPGEEAVGKRLRWIGPDGPLFDVVGVASEVQDLELGGDPLPIVYLPQHVIGWPTLTMAMRSSGPLDPVADGVRLAVREMDPLLAAPEMSTLASQRDDALARPLLSLRLVALSALIALVLAAVGVYGMVAYSVSRRRRELGVRMAIGARPQELVSLVARDALMLIAGGLGLGVLASLAMIGGLRPLLYEISPFDPQVLTVVSLILATVGLVAGTLPAIRAARVDPVTVLREE